MSLIMSFDTDGPIQRMNHLRLYKEIYHESDGECLRRLLFETCQITLYIWITPKNELHSFQFLYDGTYALSYGKNESLSRGIVGANPINRAISGRFKPGDEGIVINEINKMYSKDLPSLINKVKWLAIGCNTDKALEQEEIAYLNKLRVYCEPVA